MFTLTKNNSYNQMSFNILFCFFEEWNKLRNDFFTFWTQLRRDTKIGDDR